MTFENAAWAIDGALLGSSLARRAEYAATGGAQGTVQKNDLRVTELGVPGVGILVEAGVGLVKNEYQTVPNETYVVSNPSTHTVPSIEMPAANPSAKSYIVAVVVGDPDFSQTGHPWMGSDDPPIGDEQTFEYVRVTLIEVSAGATSLDVNYPALPLARIDVPADTTTITDSMITDLRSLALPRQSQEIFVSPGGTFTYANPRYIDVSSGTWYNWGAADYGPYIDVPEWATRAIVVTSINGIVIRDTGVNIVGNLRTRLGTVTGPITKFDYDNTGAGILRDNLQCAGEFDVSSIAGQKNVALRVEGYQHTPGSPTLNQRLSLRGGSQQIFDVRFFEE